MKATPALMLPRSIAIVLGVLFATAMIASLNGCQRGAAQAPRAPARSPASSARDFGPHISPTTCALCAETNPLFVVDKDGNASGAVRLRNRGKEAVTLQLTLSDFSALADDGRTDLLNAVSTLSAVDTAAKPILEGTAQLQPDRWIEVKISAANLWQAGLSTAALMNGTEKLIDLRALRYNVPFNIKVQGATPERADVSFSKSQEGAVTLRNDDPMTYRFRWKVEIDGRAIENVDVVRPYKSIRLPITLPPESFPWLATGTLRPDVREGLLTLEYEPDTGLRNYPLPVKRYPITARLSYWGETAQTIWNSAWILTLLLGAGIRDRRLAQQERLLRALDPGPDASLQKACEIVEQTRENVYVEDVVGEIENAAISIDVDPPRPLPYQLTDFSLRFARAGVDRAVARKEIVYEWSVNGEKLPAEDWSVTWFFQDKWRWLKTIQRTLTFWNRTTQAHYQVRVNLKKPGMESSLRQLEQDVTLERTRSSVEAQTWLSLGTLGVTILAVVLGLASGAEEKLRSVELLPGAIAVFLLGFGADTLKTLITRISR